MVTDPLVRTEGGFTLIEIVVAMVILAIGLLGLEALGIGAARSIALADRQSAYATIASDSLESAMQQFRLNSIPTQFCQTDLKHGDRLSRSVVISNGQLAQVTVRVIPNPDSYNAPQQEFQLTSSLFIPSFSGGSASGQPCN